MKHRPIAAVLAATLLLAPTAAPARSACMATPLATFAGEGARLSPDGRVLALESDAALRFVSFPALTPLASYPHPPGPLGFGFGFTPDKKRLWILRQDGNGLGLVFLDLGSALPAVLPPPALSFPGLPERAVAGEGAFAFTADSTQKVYPKPGSMASAQNYIGTIFSGRLLRSSDGAVISRFEHMADYFVSDHDVTQRRLIVSFYDNPTSPDSNRYILVDTVTGQQRGLPDDSNPDLSPDGNAIVLRDLDNKAMRVLDAATGAALGAVRGTSWDAIAADSNTFLFGPDGTIPAQALRRGAWGTPVAVPGLAGIGRTIGTALEGNRLLFLSDKGEIGLLDLSTLQRVWTIAAGVTPDFAFGSVTSSPGLDRIAAYLIRKDETRRFLVADGASGRVMCQGDLPKDASIQAVTSTHIFISAGSQREGSFRSAVYAIEDEASARAKTERQVAEASARSAKLPPAKRAEAQQIFKQAFELFRAGEFDAAARLFESGLAIDPGNASAQYYLGETYAHAGKKDKALAHYELAAGLAPTSKEGALAASRLGE